MLPSSTCSQHNEAVAAPGVPARLWLESPWRRGPGHGKLQLEFIQKTASRWTDDSPRTGDTSGPNWTPLHVDPEKLCACCCAAQTEDFPLLLGSHSPQRPRMQFVSSGICRNNSQDLYSSSGMLISISIGVNLKKHVLLYFCTWSMTSITHKPEHGEWASWTTWHPSPQQSRVKSNSHLRLFELNANLSTCSQKQCCNAYF